MRFQHLVGILASVSLVTVVALGKASARETGATSTAGPPPPNYTYTPSGPGDPVGGSLSAATMHIQQNAPYFTTVTGTDSDEFNEYIYATGGFVGVVSLGASGDLEIDASNVPVDGDFIPGTTTLFPVAGSFVTYSQTAQSSSSITLTFQRQAANLGLTKGSDPMICHDNYFVKDKSDPALLTHDPNVVHLQEIVIVDAPTS